MGYTGVSSDSRPWPFGRPSRPVLAEVIQSFPFASVMALIEILCTERKPGPFAAQVRLCAHLGCESKLNQWNEGPCCYAHQADHFMHLGIPIRPKAPA
jgi:hypothetical protein